MGRPKNRPESIWKFIDKAAGQDACWPWTGCRNDDGYGVIGINWKQESAHRLAYQLSNGEIPDGMLIMHKCDNPPCCNPKHLVIGTNADNSADRDKKQRQSKGKKHSDAVLPNRPRGSNHYAAKISEKTVLEMRALRALNYSTRHISEKFNLPFSTTQKIILRITWRHI